MNKITRWINSRKEWFNDHKVLIIGLIISASQPAIDVYNTGGATTKVWAIAAIGGALSYIYRNMRGQWVTIAGVLQLALTKYGAGEMAGGFISWFQILFQAFLAYLAAAAPAPKSIGYEHSNIIIKAKQQGELITPTVAPPPPTEI